MSGCIPPSMLDDYVRRSLSEGQREHVEAHVEDCAACHAALVERELNEIPMPEPGAPLADRASLGAERRPAELIGPYRVLEELGRGGQARVYLVEDSRLRRKVALKVFDAGLGASDHVLARFQREAAALSRVEHPGICTVHETGEHDGRPFIAMRYVEGESLAQRIGRRAKEAGSTAADDLMATVSLIERGARALHVAHQAGLVHRDIKPSNILITPDDEPVIVDFGLARDEESADQRLTRTGDLTGTPAYMAPEQVRGDKSSIDRRTDVFALGATLYEALTLRLPFEAPTTAGIFQRILTGEWTPPSQIGRALPTDLLVILQTAMEQDRERRYQSALALAEDLRRFREHETILARPAGPGLRLRRWARRNPVVAVSLAAAFLLLCSGLAISTVLLERVRRESDARAAALRREEGLRLALQSSAILPENPGRALLLAVEAAERSPSLAANYALLGAVQGSHERARLFGHTGQVSHARFSPDGLRVVTASVDRTARLWDAASGQALAILDGHGAEVATAEFSPDGRRVLTAAQDATARIWDAETGREVLRLAGHDHGLLLATFSPDGSRVLTVGRDSARLWDAATGQLLHLLVAHRDPIHCAAFAPGGTAVATGSQDKSAIVWDTASGERRLDLQGHGETVTALAFSGDGTKLLTAAFDGGAIVWDAASGARIAELKGHRSAVGSVRLSQDGTLAATGSADFTARLWDVQSGAQRHAFQHDHTVSSLALSRDGRLLLTASYDGKARLWGTRTGKLLAELEGHAAGLAYAAFSPDGDLVVTASADFTARIWSLRPPWPRNASAQFAGSVEMAWLDTPGERVAALREPQSTVAEVVSLSPGATAVRLAGHQAEVTAVRFHPDGKTVLTTSRDATARLWDAGTGELLRELRGHEGPVLAARFSADGRRVATASEDRSVRIWDAADGVVVSKVTGPPSPFFIASLSPDGRHVVCGARDATLLLADAGTGEVIRPLEDGTRYLRSVEWSPDGRRVVASNKTGLVQVRDPFTGGVLGALIHPAGAEQAVYSPDGRWIGTVCHDFIVRIWDARLHEEVLQLKLERLQLYAISFDAGGRWIAAFSIERNSQLDSQSSAMGRLLLFPLDPLGEARRLLPGRLTPDERDQYQVGSPEERAAYRASWSGGGPFGAAR